jgi:hypothetical protein
MGSMKHELEGVANEHHRRSGVLIHFKRSEEASNEE